MDEQNQGQGSCCCGGDKGCFFGNIDWKGIVEKLIAVLKSPKGFWEAQKNVGEEIADIYKKYLLAVVVISSVLSFIKASIIGYEALGVESKMPVISGFVFYCAQCLLMLVLLYLFAMIIEFLAPKFDASISREKAFQLVAYSSLPGLVASFLVIVPSIFYVFTLLVGIYGLYIFYVGIEVMTGCPEEKTLKLTASSIALFVVASVVLHIIVGSVVRPEMKTSGQPNFIINGIPNVQTMK